MAERKARQRFEALSTTLAMLRLQNGTIANYVAIVRERVEEGTHMVREEIERSSKETCTALQELNTRSTAVFGILRKVGQLSTLTVMT